MNGMRTSITTLATCALLYGAHFAVLAGPVALGDAERAALATLEPLRGKAPEVSDLRERAVIVTFFASWCPPCRTEFGHLNRIAMEFENADLTIVAVNVFEAFDDNDEVRLARFLDDTEPRFHVVKGDASIRRAFGEVERIPTVLVFDRAGKPVMHFIHARGAKKMSVTEDELRAALARALGQ